MLFLEHNSKFVGKYWMQLYDMFVLCLDKINIYYITQKNRENVEKNDSKNKKTIMIPLSPSFSSGFKTQ